jgi:hypothetical protein
MASVPAQKPSPGTPSQSMKDQFRGLAAAWEAATAHLSSMTVASKHPAYQEIIALGPVVVPLLLRDMEEHETHWFIALERMTGANPVPPSAAGNIPEMVQAWLTWAKDHGYRW